MIIDKGPYLFDIGRGFVAGQQFFINIPEESAEGYAGFQALPGQDKIALLFVAKPQPIVTERARRILGYGIEDEVESRLKGLRGARLPTLSLGGFSEETESRIERELLLEKAYGPGDNRTVVPLAVILEESDINRLELRIFYGRFRKDGAARDSGPSRLNLPGEYCAQEGQEKQ